MPFSSRGAQYYGNALSFLNCKNDHDQMANSLYVQLKEAGKANGTSSCPSCGAYITVSVRPQGEWEHKIFSRGRGKER